MRYLTDLPNMYGKHVLVRVDFNIPITHGIIQDDTRLIASLPTIRFLQRRGAKIILVSHRKNPRGRVKKPLSLAEISSYLGSVLNTKILFVESCIGKSVQAKIKDLGPGEILMLENVRFEAGELKNDPKFVKELAKLADFFVFEAFGVVHREHASTIGLAKALPSFVGKLMEQEVKILGQALEGPPRPLVVVLGGAKIESKIGVLKRFSQLADTILLGGGIANTFLAAQNFAISKSLYEPSQVGLAREILAQAKENGCELRLPWDVTRFLAHASNGKNFKLEFASQAGLGKEQALRWRIVDIGQETQAEFQRIILQAKLVVWNGPLGVFETLAASQGTGSVVEACQKTEAKTIIGGGDTLAALHHFQVSFKDFTHISTGGGAMLKFLEGGKLPVLEALGGA